MKFKKLVVFARILYIMYFKKFTILVGKIDFEFIELNWLW